MPFTDLGKDRLLSPLQAVVPAYPVNWHLALTSTNPGRTGLLTGELPFANGYARAVSALVDWTLQNGLFTNSRELINDFDIPFPLASGAWGSAVYVVGCDAATAGSAWWYYPVPGGAFAADRAGLQLIVYTGTLHLDLADP